MRIILNINNDELTSLSDPNAMKTEWIKQVRKYYGLILQTSIRLANLFFEKTEGFSTSLTHEISIDDIAFFKDEKERLKATLYEKFKNKGLNQGLLLLPQEKENEAVCSNIDEKINFIENEIKNKLDPKMHYLLEEYKLLITQNSQPFA